MDTQSRAATQLLETLSFVNTLREVTGGVKVIQALLETSAKEWDNSKDANTDTHLIQGVAVSTKKSDAVHIYITKIVAQHMRSVGNRQTAWTKGTLASEHHTNIAVTNRIVAGDFQTHVDLFKIVAGRLLGYDDGLFEFALAETPRDKAEALVAYMATRFDLSDDRACALVDYLNATDFVEVMFEKEGFTNEYFLKTIGQVITYFGVPTSDGSSHLTDPFDVLDMLATESDFDSLGEASAILGVTVHTVIIDKDDPDPLATIELLKKTYGENVKIVPPLSATLQTALSTAQLSVSELTDVLRKEGEETILSFNHLNGETDVIGTEDVYPGKLPGDDDLGIVDAHREPSVSVKTTADIVPPSAVKIGDMLKDYTLAGDGEVVDYKELAQKTAFMLDKG